MKRVQQSYVAATTATIFFFQCIATCCIWDMKMGVLLYFLMALLCIIQFPTFIIIMCFLFLAPVPSNSIFSCLAEKAFSIYLSKFYVFAIAHSILWHHFLTGEQYIMSKSSLYILLLYGLLFISSPLPDSPSICLLLFPLEVLSPLGLYVLVDNGLSRIMVTIRRDGHDCHSK